MNVRELIAIFGYSVPHSSITVQEREKEAPKPLLYRADGTPLVPPPAPPIGFKPDRKR